MRVLHVLPHPGGGGDTYVNTLAAMAGCSQERRYLAQAPDQVLRAAWNALRVGRAAAHAEVLHVHGEAAGALCLPSLARRPSVLTLHGLNLLRRLQGLRRAAATLNLRALLRAAGRTICVSRAEHAELLEAAGPALAGRAAVIHNGVDLPAPPSAQARSRVRSELRIPDNACVGVFVGSLEAHKDPLTLARAAQDTVAAGVPLCMLVIGEGPLRSALEQEARRSAAVRLLGERSDVQQLLAAADFFCLASRREGLAFSLLEAMSLGLAAVVTDVPGNREALGDAGVLVPFGDRTAFGAAFARICGNPAERSLLGGRGRERVATLFRARDMLERTREVYDEVLRQRAGR
jgi:glycosyltransferase involved in cell wall biosynthesis